MGWDGEQDGCRNNTVLWSGDMVEGGTSMVTVLLHYLCIHDRRTSRRQRSAIDEFDLFYFTEQQTISMQINTTSAVVQ